MLESLTLKRKNDIANYVIVSDHQDDPEKRRG